MSTPDDHVAPAPRAAHHSAVVRELVPAVAELRVTYRLVLAMLGHFVDGQSMTAWPGLDALAEATGLHKQTVREALIELRRVGAIELVAGGHRGRRAVYRLRSAADVATDDHTVRARDRRTGEHAPRYRRRGSDATTPIPERGSDVPTERGSDVTTKRGSGVTTPLRQEETGKRHLYVGDGSRLPDRTVDALDGAGDDERCGCLVEITGPADLLADLIVGNGRKVRPTVTCTAWHRPIRLMLTRDQLTAHEIEGAIRWSQADPFWKANILSPAKLRAKYEQLRLKAQADRQRQTTTPPTSKWAAALSLVPPDADRHAIEGTPR